MTEYELEDLPGAQLFQLCAEHLDENRCWEEFVRRYNGLLVRAVNRACRRFASTESFLPAAAADLLQEVYTELLKDDCRALRRFRGEAEPEAEAYLAHIAIRVTVGRLRREQALKRQVTLISLEEILWELDELGRLPDLRKDSPVKLSEYELTEIIHRIFTGPNNRRDALLLLLHMYDGLTARELAEAGICDLKQSTIAAILTRMKTKLKESFSE